MKSIFLFIGLFFLFTSAQAIHFFSGSYEAALEKARAENKNIFISFTTSWCGPCRMMHKMVFENHKVTQYTDEHYICLLLDIEFPENQLLQQRINPDRAGGVPHLCILTPDEKIIKESGSLTIHQMMNFLKITPKDQPLRGLIAPGKVPDINQPARLFDHRTSYAEVLEQARRENKNMLLYFSSHFCGPCQIMQKTTFRIPEIMEKVNRTYATGYFEVGDPQDRALCYRYHNQQTGIPFLVLATPDERIIRKHIGYLDSASFLAFIQPSAENSQEYIKPESITFNTDKAPSIWAKAFYNMSHHRWKLRITAGATTTTLRTSGTLSDMHFNYRTGYEFGFSLAREWQHFAFAPGLSFASKGGKSKGITLRQNYLELPVKLTWIYQNQYNAWWKGLSASPYGSIRIGGKLKTEHDNLLHELLTTKRFDYGLRCATNMRFASFDFEFGYLVGLCNISDHPGGKMYNRGFFLNTSLCF